MTQKIPPPKVYDALNYVMKYYPDRYTEQARVEIEMLLDHCMEGLDNDSEKFLSTLMIKALRHLIGPSKIDEHIYLKKYEITQIELFKTLIQEFPFVKHGHSIANALIFNKLKNAEKGVILDIGIGQGIQIQNLIYKLKDNSSLKKLTIIGIEPFDEALKTAQNIFDKISKDVQFKIEFVPWRAFVQDISEEKLKEKLKDYPGELIINSSLTLHHIQLLNQRTKVLKMLRSINPKGIVLIEPNIDHYEPDFQKRFQNCYQHFYHIFQVIDSLEIDKNSKNGLKLFFGREIEDIIGKTNEERYEKHEPAFRWIEKLNESNFKNKNNFLKDLPNINSGIKLKYHKEGYLGFTYKEETILSIIYAESE